MFNWLRSLFSTPTVPAVPPARSTKYKLHLLKLNDPTLYEDTRVIQAAARLTRNTDGFYKFVCVLGTGGVWVTRTA